MSLTRAAYLPMRRVSSLIVSGGAGGGVRLLFGHQAAGHGGADTEAAVLDGVAAARQDLVVQVAHDDLVAELGEGLADAAAHHAATHHSYELDVIRRHDASCGMSVWWG